MFVLVTEPSVPSFALSFDPARIDGQTLRIRNLEQKSVRLAAPLDVLPECEREGLSWLHRCAIVCMRYSSSCMK
jgi:hypothetical protein